MSAAMATTNLENENATNTLSEGPVPSGSASENENPLSQTKIQITAQEL